MNILVAKLTNDLYNAKSIDAIGTICNKMPNYIRIMDSAYKMKLPCQQYKIFERYIWKVSDRMICHYLDHIDTSNGNYDPKDPYFKLTLVDIDQPVMKIPNSTSKYCDISIVTMD